MSGYGNSGIIPEVAADFPIADAAESSRVESADSEKHYSVEGDIPPVDLFSEGQITLRKKIFYRYSSERPYLACSPSKEAAARVLRNRKVRFLNVEF